MLITRECDYAFRIVRNMNDAELVSVTSIVEREQLTLSIAYKVARKLEKGGLLKSVRGNSGGYRLTRPLSEVTLYDVYSIMDPDAGITHCMKEACPLNTENSPCKVHKELERIQDSLHAEMSRRSFEDLI